MAQVFSPEVNWIGLIGPEAVWLIGPCVTPRVLAACLAVVVGLALYVQGLVLLDRWAADHMTVGG